MDAKDVLAILQKIEVVCGECKDTLEYVVKEPSSNGGVHLLKIMPCDYCARQEARKFYEKGYDEGYEEGYNKGYDKGFDEGYDEGYEKGKNEE